MWLNIIIIIIIYKSHPEHSAFFQMPQVNETYKMLSIVETEKRPKTQTHRAHVYTGRKGMNTKRRERQEQLGLETRKGLET